MNPEIVAPPAPRARFPGWDGWALVLLDLVVVLVAAVRGLDGMGAPVALVVGLAAAWLGATAWLRRAPPTPQVAGPVRPLVVIPVRNNAGTIAEVVRGCLHHTPDVLVVDDGSTDRSGELASEAGARVVRHAVNQGKGAALETALRLAAELGFSHIIAIDADGQHRPSDLPAFLAAIAADPGAIHAGLRDGSRMPKGARYARANSNFWVRVETGRWIGDTQCGLRAYPVGPVRALGLVPSRYQWEVEVLVRALWTGLPVRDLACDVYYPPAGERVSSYRKVVDTARVTWLNTQLVLERLLWPPRWLAAGPGTWRGAHRGFTGGWRLYLWILRVAGRRVVHVALVPLVAFYWLFLRGAQRRGIAEYLRRRFPGTSGVLRSYLLFRVLLNFAWALADRFHVLLRGPDGIPIDRSAVPGLRERLDTGEGLLLVSAHLGNPDLGSAALRSRDRRVHLLMYSSPGDPYLRLMSDVMGDRAPVVIALNDDASHASLQALRALRDGGIVAVKADRVVDGRVAEVQFLGGTIALPTGPLLLAALSGAPVVVLGCFREGDGYRLEAFGPRIYRFESRESRDADLARWAQELADQLAGWTERWPLQWYNFFDPWSR